MRIISGLSKGQVLQRLGSKGARVDISGDCSESGPVLVSCSGKNGVLRGWKNRASGRAAQGTFAVHLAGIPAGGPYRLELRCGRASARVREFFVGDVWLLAGQSNMQGIGNMTGAPKTHPLIHSFSMRREWRKAAEPLHVLAESPDFCHNGGKQCSLEEGEELRKSPKGVGSGLFFARAMLERSGVPQGLICTAQGGTSMTQWTPRREIDGKVSLYGSLMNSVEATGQPVAGMLWYQGESDANAKDLPHYTARMKELVAALRKDLRLPKLPWLTVQLARVFGARSGEEDANWNQLQEQQRLLPRTIRNLAVVAAIDLPLDDNIHISAEGQARLAVRLAREADRLAYGNRRETRPPQLKPIPQAGGLGLSRRSLGMAVDVGFDCVEGGLRSTGEPVGFALVDEAGKDLRGIYKITLHGNVARLHLGASPIGARICYGLGAVPICNITDARDHSLPVFSPQVFGKPQAWLPFVKQWKVTPPVPASESLGKIGVPDVEAHGAEIREYGENEFKLDGFINEHPRWREKNGHCYFAARIELPESMRLEFLMGYDGPFRLWIDGAPFFADLKGTNPCFPDESRKTAQLSAGAHSIRVAMDVNHGAAWGFFLRFIRKDVTQAQIKSGNYAKPGYSV